MKDNERKLGKPDEDIWDKRWQQSQQHPRPFNLGSIRWINRKNIALIFTGHENKELELIEVTAFLVSGARIDFITNTVHFKTLFGTEVVKEVSYD